jgi:hypothetical protein
MPARTGPARPAQGADPIAAESSEVKRMCEQRFRFRQYSKERLWAARWHLFEFPEVRNIIHLGGGIVAVLHDGDPHVQDWVELLDEHGFEIEPVTQPSLEMDAI